MAWNFWGALFGTRKGHDIEQAAMPVLTAVAPGVAVAITAVDTVAGDAGNATTIGAASLSSIEEAIVAGVNTILTSKGVDPVTEAEVDGAITAAFAASAKTGGAS